MADLASTNVTVTLNRETRDLVPESEKLFQLVTVAFGDGALTYPSGGVPMPAIGNFGFKIQVDAGICIPPSAVAYQYKYDATNNKIRIYTPAAEWSASSDAVAATTLKMLMIGT